MNTATAQGLQVMTAQDVAKMVMNNEELFILDVRNESDFNDWKIEGESIEIINIPYFDLLDGVDPALSKIPESKKVLVVCAKEGSSKFVGEQIVEAGRANVFYLQGGMKTWSEHLEPVKVGDLKAGGELYQFVRIGKGCLSYMIISNGEAAVIDTVRMTSVFDDFAKSHQAKIKHTMDTHLHADHISGGKQLADRVGATYWLPPKDAEEVTFLYNKLEEGQDITVGNTTVKIHPIYSPGHTIGSTSFIVDDRYLLTGDILFVESIGRPDLAGKAEDWVGDLRQTLYDRFAKLSMDLEVLPAHFGKVSELGEQGKVSARLGDLFKQNPGLQIHDEQEFRRTVTENLPPQPNAYQEIRQTNMGKMKPTEDEQQEMEIGPNRCAVHDK
ncbi:MBL fold metallo-hydrolase [Ammoniphilus resinae]|uniref:Glyoxylase-like metal-dependent hydrolase (Beta-lactamase superfamily II) n=1 Tax=Ammoniphilus resinae TaxID=861532 RepID=A0ABS4GKX1_9BACL|nr:MBL fold metallo-hydrolase [Ammoniphilus resinae]MBP1930874.1 glyoxylase-like metal-dependent hydrolase (beta-lactamase superfamily II) [Ammoniphilus resinae]